MLVALLALIAQTPWQSMTAAEIAFSDLSVAKGMKPAFTTYLSEQSITFSPGPGLGLAWWRARPAPGARKARLSWKPLFGAMAASGDFGFDFGPTRVEDIATGAEIPNTAGLFFSVWHKEGNNWRVILDAGAPNGKLPAGFAPVFEVAEAVATPVDPEFLLAMDAQNNAFSDQTVWLRPGLAAALGATNWRINRARTPMKAVIAPSGDMGYVYGSVPGGYYARVYQQRGGTWRVLLDVDLPTG